MKTKRRNPIPPHRHTKNNALRTEKRIEQYLGVKALVDTWERQSDEVQIENHDYIIRLRARLRNVRNYLMHRAVDVKI